MREFPKKPDSGGKLIDISLFVLIGISVIIAMCRADYLGLIILSIVCFLLAAKGPCK